MFIWQFILNFRFKLKNKESPKLNPEKKFSIYFLDILNDPDIKDSSIGVGAMQKITIPMRQFYQLLNNYGRFDRSFAEFIRNSVETVNVDLLPVEKVELLQLVVIFANRYCDNEGVIPCSMDECVSDIAVKYSSDVKKIHVYKLAVRELISSCGYFSYVHTDKGIRLKLNRNKIKTVPPVNPADDEENLPTSPPPVVDDRTSTP